MRIATSSLLIAGLVSGSALVAIPSAAAPFGVDAPGSVTVCAKAPGKSAPVSIEVGFIHEGGDQKNTYSVANNKCVTVADAPAPSGTWADAERQAKRIVVKTPSGKTNLKKTDRADFTLGSDDNVTVVFYFTPR